MQPTIKDAINEFMIDQQIKGNTHKTQEYYRCALLSFTRFYDESNPLESIDLPLLRKYSLSLQSGDLCTVSIQSYVRALRAFLAWCYHEDLLQTNLSEKFRLPKAKRQDINVLTDAEVQRLMGYFNQKSTLQLRNYCICALMLDSGLRMDEVVTLTVESMHAIEGYAIVDGKGNKQRSVPLGLGTRRAVTRYLRRRPGAPDTGRLFLQSNGTPVTQTTVKMLFRKLKKDLAIPRLHPHLLRHTFATRFLQNGGDMYTLQSILGHTSLEMVKRYIHLTHGKTLVKFPEYSPLDRLTR